MNISRLESGKISIDKEDLDLNELIKEVVEEYRITSLNHVIEIAHCNDITINADRDKIASVLSNLVNNAIKYSPKKAEVSINCSTDHDHVIVSVSDKGLGIAPQDITKIFERYYRSHDNAARHISGFGIGLYLSAEIIQRHGGRIWAESVPGEGSSFHFSIPLR